MKEITVKSVMKLGLEPVYSSTHAAGADLRADIAQQLVIEPGDYILVPTGLHMELPEGYEAQVRPRSGLAAKNGVTVLNSPGTIDSDYRGEVKVILINHGKKPFIIEHGDRIAQMIIAPVVQAHFLQADNLKDSERGEGGFGSTGTR